MYRSLSILFVAILLFATAFAAEENRPLKITKKPRPSAQGCEGSGGRSIVRVTFKSDATIGEVEFVEESSCRAFNESLLRVVKEIEFQPEVREGQPVTIKRQIEYQWARY